MLVSKELSDFQQQIIDQGIEVEDWARNLYPDGELVDVYGDEAVAMTRQKIVDGGQVIFQATFAANGLFSMSDMIVWNAELESWDIYEVKGTTSKQRKKTEHYWDVAFQREVLEQSREPIGRLFLVELNKEFVKNGDIAPEELLALTDVTEEVDTMRIEIQTEIGSAKKWLKQTKEPKDCDCLYHSKANQCAAFDYLYPNVPEYSVYNISRIGSSRKKLAALIEDGIFAIEDIPQENELSAIQGNQVHVHNMDTEIFLRDKIFEEIAKIEYPIYFLDYETIPTAIPLYNACFPFQQVPFQYSLHIQDKPGAVIRHLEFIHREKSNPIPFLAKRLREDIGDNGSVVVWNKSFEGMCNKDMANQVPSLAPFLLDINLRMYDLLDVFNKQMYVRKEFLGKTSIKYVLPVLVPELSYKDLNIQDGGAASSTYKRIIWDNIHNQEQESTFKDLLAYCKLDTWAMVAILEHLKKRIR